MSGSLRQAGRSLARSPGYALAVILTLALGIGGAAAVTSVLRSVLLRPLPSAPADRVMSLFESDSLGNIRPISYPTFQDLRAAAPHTFEALAFARGLGLVLKGDGGADPATKPLMDMRGALLSSSSRSCRYSGVSVIRLSVLSKALCFSVVLLKVFPVSDKLYSLSWCSPRAPKWNVASSNPAIDKLKFIGHYFFILSMIEEVEAPSINGNEMTLPPAASTSSRP